VDFDPLSGALILVLLAPGAAEAMKAVGPVTPDCGELWGIRTLDDCMSRAVLTDKVHESQNNNFSSGFFMADLKGSVPGQSLP
jgi:hypothetical protein